LISESSDEENVVELLPDDGPAVLVREDLTDEEEDFDDQVRFLVLHMQFLIFILHLQFLYISFFEE
jgi:hypothetical protein